MPAPRAITQANTLHQYFHCQHRKGRGMRRFNNSHRKTDQGGPQEVCSGLDRLLGDSDRNMASDLIGFYTDEKYLVKFRPSLR
ncbi:hypothetical protein RRG08_038333 [Elysia crispata]|uniref:Uncharacterized protein n=1 Tax=Elysia crispata TaxID=231223 RepID=A0AAE1E2V4_9GAST|nr:hypothetical protein RRG08_038333 [Elysia crispata]